MERRCSWVLIVLISLVSAGIAEGADSVGDPKKGVENGAAGKGPVAMEEVVVTAGRYAEETGTVPLNVTVITANDIANSTAQDIPEVLNLAVGVHVSDVTGNRRTYKVDLRGFGETAQSNTLVLVDGRRINEPDLSGTDWTLIPLERVKRIEVVRGSRSVLYGDNASGGVINIITKEGEKFQAGANAAGGSYDTFSGDAYLSGSKGDFSYALNGDYYDSDGYRDNSQMEAENLGVNLGYLFGNFMRLGLTGGYHKDDTGLPGALKKSELEAGIPRTATVHPDDFANTEDYYAAVTLEIFLLQDSSFQIPVSYRKRDWSSFSSFSGGTFEGDTSIETVIASPQVVLKEPVFGFKNNLTSGFDFVNAEEDITNTVSGLFPSTAMFNLTKTNYGYFVHDEFSPISRLILSAGYRYDHVKFEFSPSVPDEADYHESLFEAGVNYQFLRNSYLYFNFSQGFRYPVLDELFDFFANTVLTGLMPQTSDDYEVGVRHYFTETLYANVNFFLIDTTDEIFFNPTGGPFGFGANENLDGKSRREGVEVTVGKRFKWASLTGGYTYTHSEVKEGRFAGSEVPGVPTHMATLDSVFDLGRGFVFVLNGKYVGQRFFEGDWANAFPEQDDYVVFNAKLKYKWKTLTAYLDVNNVFDEKYSSFGVLSSGFPVEPAFYPSPERNFLVGVRFDY